MAALSRRYAGGLFGFLQRYAGDRMLAEEILQDTLLAVWCSAHLYAGRSEDGYVASAQQHSLTTADSAV